jgi:formylglycine-generating enzyme
VSWFDAARFCNWLHNGRPTGGQDATTTERGAYTLDGATNGLSIVLNRGAKFWIPSEDEWYKAAYYHPAGRGGDVDNYWIYPMRSNAVPSNAVGPLPNQANFRTTFYSVTQSLYSVSQNYLSDAGSYTAGESYFGTFDQGGNVSEWTDAVAGGSSRIHRGGSWEGLETKLRSSDRDQATPNSGDLHLGFRVAAP